MAHKKKSVRKPHILLPITLLLVMLGGLVSYIRVQPLPASPIPITSTPLCVATHKVGKNDAQTIRSFANSIIPRKAFENKTYHIEVDFTGGREKGDDLHGNIWWHLLEISQ